MPNFRHHLRAIRVRPWQKLWQSWAPTNDERDKWAGLADEAYATSVLLYPDNDDGGRARYVTEQMRAKATEAGVGPMTWLWIATMVVELVKLWRDWRETKN